MENVLSNSKELYDQARQMMNKGEFEDAVVLFQQSVSLNPHFKTLELIGECLIRLNRLPEAIVPLAAAATLNNSVRAPSMLAEVYLQLEDYHAAGNMAETALSRDSNNRKALEVKRVIVDILGKT